MTTDRAIRGRAPLDARAPSKFVHHRRSQRCQPCTTPCTTPTRRAVHQNAPDSVHVLPLHDNACSRRAPKPADLVHPLSARIAVHHEMVVHTPSDLRRAHPTPYGGKPARARRTGKPTGAAR